MSIIMQNFKKKILIFALFALLFSCSTNEKSEDNSIVKKKRINPNVSEKVASANTAGLFSKVTGSGGTTYEFSTSNVLWRASLQALDFIPLATVSYSGGIIITDWYSSNNSKDAIKFTIRFLSNELASSSIEVSGFKKTCDKNNNCSNSKLDEKMNNEIKEAILQNARKIKLSTEKNKK